MTPHQNRLRHILCHLLYPDYQQASSNTSNKLTTYSHDFTQRYAQLKKDLHFLYDGLQTTIISQLSLYHKENNIDTSQINIIDIACGDGNYSRLLSDTFNYKTITGVDISESQINLAKLRTNSKIYSNITYECFDASLYDRKEKFDIGIAVFFYNHANTKRELYKYIQSTYNMLKPNGIVVGVTTSIKDIKQCKDGYFQNNPKLGLFLKFNRIYKGDVESYNGYKPNVLKFDIKLYDYATYKSLFEKAGFRKIRFLTSKQYKAGANSTQNEKQLFVKLFDEKFMQHNIRHVFVAQK
eukprot:342962_1